jgi:hypothetical protein
MENHKGLTGGKLFYKKYLNIGTVVSVIII